MEYLRLFKTIKGRKFYSIKKYANRIQDQNDVLFYPVYYNYDHLKKKEK